MIAATLPRCSSAVSAFLLRPESDQDVALARNDAKRHQRTSVSV
jgi:hypothetical protein